MSAIEQKYCRAPLARSFNAVSETRWIPNTNASFSAKFGNEQAFSADYESGRPDAFVWQRGRVICVECKAAFERFYLADWKAKPKLRDRRRAHQEPMMLKAARRRQPATRLARASTWIKPESNRRIRSGTSR